MNGRGLILAAPSSGSGKTTVTLGILRAFVRKGFPVRSAKSGPDYIDPRFHEAASGAACLNLDAWAMKPARIRELAACSQTLLIEGAMGLFDGAPPNGRGATADLARILKLPVVLVIDTAKLAQSVVPLVAGFAGHDSRVNIAGLILNNVGSPRHEKMLRGALDGLNIPVIGAIFRQPNLTHPSRHLGLVQAAERGDLDDFLEKVADVVTDHLDLDMLLSLAAPIAAHAGKTNKTTPPAQRTSIARDQAFAFAYPHLLADWHAAGASLSFFSPLADEAPPPGDLIILPGGYPELHAGKLAAAGNFMNGLRDAAATTDIYGECGGYMVLGDCLTDGGGKDHAMAGLLRLHTSFAKRRLHLGYRRLEPQGGLWDLPLNGHEFHYATTVTAKGDPLFTATNAEGEILPPMGLIRGRVSGSFAHVIDRAD